MSRRRELDVTVDELVQLIARHKQALTEAGRPDLAERAHVCIWPDGGVSMNYAPRRRRKPSSPEPLKAMEIDPLWKVDTP